MQLYLRDADASDLPHLVSLLVVADHPLDADGFDHVHDYADALREIEQTPGSYVLVADYGGSAVAMVQLATHRRLSRRGGRSASVESLIVAEAWRRRGVGSELLDHAIGRTIDLGCHEIRIDIERSAVGARSFLQHCGFEMTLDGGRRSLDLDWTPSRSAQYRWAPTDDDALV